MNTPIRQALANFPHDLMMTEDPMGTPQVAFGFESMAIYDASISDCGRFEANADHYGLTEDQHTAFQGIRMLLDDAVNDALDAGCIKLQMALGVEAGDVAGVFFSGDEDRNRLRLMLGNYFISEVNLSVKGNPAVPA